MFHGPQPKVRLKFSKRLVDVAHHKGDLGDRERSARTATVEGDSLQCVFHVATPSKISSQFQNILAGSCH